VNVAVKEAVGRADIVKHLGGYTFRDSFAYSLCITGRARRHLTRQSRQARKRGTITRRFRHGIIG
jgi:hypothetical protein